ncbi:glycosyltransferase family 2 protein [Jannaschia marina]|uniref:glycosyltransferase family 2 protein n=1 Tax=Jannaschia marina TaxID=2741674 RepID=UPI0015C716AF|nr:glycosyltransferase family 2 protein [Jannaschia marina]
MSSLAAFRSPVPDPEDRAATRKGLWKAREDRRKTAPEPEASSVGTPARMRPKLGEVLLDMGAISGSDLAHALTLQRRMSARLGDVLLRGEIVDAETLADALARQRGIGRAGPAPRGDAAADALARRMPLDMSVFFRAIPWRKVGSLTLVATARPEAIDTLADLLPPLLGPCLFSVVTDAAFDDRLTEIHGKTLARAAECEVPKPMSCRSWHPSGLLNPLALLPALLIVAAIAAPLTFLKIATALGLLVMCSNLGLRIAALLAARRTPTKSPPPEGAAAKLPSVSLLVPLHREPEIAASLTHRLSRLDYPKELLDICLVVEADDFVTRNALEKARLPATMRVITVPDGSPRTKPRAMNYALNFARGEIVGIYDAEDAPAPDQIMRVARRFQEVPEDVACLQGLLDYYNPTRNIMSRCFTIEYATWFRLVLPGLSRLGLAVPLGGTTLFFRRKALDRIGGWDAHNVTEDADLGIRLARLGYRTEIIRTTTLEEANAHPLAWIKQRSRWIKGYVLTWAVHSRRPLKLLRELGPRRWIGFHLLFMGSVLNALLMPFLWSTAVILFGLHHPVLDWLPGESPAVLAGLLIGGTLTSMVISWFGCATPHHRPLRPWIPLMEAYFWLATLAVMKALAEIVFRPFHWDKTTHGTFGGTDGSDFSHLETAAQTVDVDPVGHIGQRG